MRARRSVLGVALAALLATAVAACNSATTTTTTTTTTLPPLPPQVYAYVTMIGFPGSNIGLGHTVVPVNISVGGNGPGAAVAVGTYPDAIAITPDGARGPM